MKLLLSLFLFSSITIFAQNEVDWLLLKDPNLAAKVRYDLINAEKEMIFASVYTLRSDTSSLAHLAFLRKKAQEGVKVKLLIDGHGNELPKTTLKMLIEDGVDVRIYNGIDFLKLRKNFNRNHTKILYFQGQDSVILGDRNFKNMYFPTTKDSTESIDILLESKKVKDDTLHFLNELWEASDTFDEDGLSQFRIDLARKRIKIIERSATIWLKTKEQFKNLEWKMMLSRIEFAELVFDELINSKKHLSGHHQAIIRLLERSQKSLTLVTPYFVLSDDIKLAIKRAHQRGVKIEILTNSIKSSDVKLAALAAKRDLTELFNLGIDIHLFNGSQLLHAKTYLSDQAEVYIGSFNLDMISRYNNLESGIILNDQKLYNQLYEDLKIIKGKSKQVLNLSDIANERALKCGNWFLENLLKIPLLRRHL